ncbi:MAG: putative 26S proteasome non-ATPase regulatory subunit 14 [Streblomastix strix]|uniref:Putative 26S proteasome non-ATPase regulatory subunit 14 n=1 Tax=Streblomastix strix TaxID=222440 RepID=A0A5J4W164_9EUKA|nr:MAG: putative 26S proteasome non-ATPase regulatory subunit 14 [Streblomastix strix]
MDLRQIQDILTKKASKIPPDYSETIQITSLALLKMLKHCHDGSPNQVMGIMLGTVVDDYTICVDDAFALPQVGWAINIDSIDVEFLKKMLKLQKQTQNKLKPVGWYHSHPGKGPFLDTDDAFIQKEFQQEEQRFAAVVIDPIQSCYGHVIIGAFRLVSQETFDLGVEPRLTTSNIGHLERPLVYSKTYYKMLIKYSLKEKDRKLLMSMKPYKWFDGLIVKRGSDAESENEGRIQNACELLDLFNQRLKEEHKLLTEKKSPQQIQAELAVKYVGKIDPRRNMDKNASIAIEDTLSQSLAAMIFNVTF